ncbi:hypothetical protein N182_27760 [Sinorhizobium sp. GL2]|nr:hypothetical protein N182_27760 [Sinorhizobium sp. GL2]
MITPSSNDPGKFQSIVPAKSKYAIAVERSFAPFVTIEEGNVSGLAIDRLNALARLCDVDLEYIAVEASGIQAMIAEGRADAAFPLAINPDRLALFDFSDTVLTTGGGLFVAPHSLPPASLQELDGKAIATPRTGPLASFIRDTLPGTALILTNDYIEPLRMVASGEADAAALNLEAGNMLVEQLFPGKISPALTYFQTLPLAMGIAKSNPEKLPLLRRINSAIRSYVEAQ